MFDRLTHRDSKGDVWIKDAAHVDEQGQICMLADRLASYDDSGLSSEEVQELAKARAEGRLAVLPCKVGDTTYTIEKRKNNHGSHDKTIIEHTVIAVIFDGAPMPFIQITGDNNDKRIRGQYIRADAIKSLIFFDCEDADKALEGGGQG